MTSDSDVLVLRSSSLKTKAEVGTNNGTGLVHWVSPVWRFLKKTRPVDRDSYLHISSN